MRKSGSKHRKAERKTEKKAGPSKLASNLIGRATTESKIFVLDTNVLIHDPTSLYRFEENDVFIPMMTLEELDAHKTGGSEVARNARQTSRLLDEIVSKCEHAIKDGVELIGPSQGLATGKLILQTEEMNGALPATLPKGKNGDNAILSVTMHLKQKFPKRRVVLVSKDINMRIKARALDIDAQDYFNDKVLEDTDLLYAGMRELPSNFWETHGKDLKSWKEEGRTFYQVQGPECSELVVNELVYFEPRADTSGKALYAMVRECGGRK
ncbi:MAG TPA: PIN domain-containing protein, partial [Candidatus Paceibacterota bacterium]